MDNSCRLWSRISLERMKQSTRGKRRCELRFFPRSLKATGWTLVHLRINDLDLWPWNSLDFVRLSTNIFMQNFIQLSAAVQRKKNSAENITVCRYRADSKTLPKCYSLFSTWNWHRIIVQHACIQINSVKRAGQKNQRPGARDGPNWSTALYSEFVFLLLSSLVVWLVSCDVSLFYELTVRSGTHDLKKKNHAWGLRRAILILTSTSAAGKAGFPSNARNGRKKVRTKRSWRNGCSNNYPQPPPLLGPSVVCFCNLIPRNKTNSNHLLRIKQINRNKSQLTLYLKKTPHNLILIINDRVSKGPHRSLRPFR